MRGEASRPRLFLLRSRSEAFTPDDEKKPSLRTGGSDGFTVKSRALDLGAQRVAAEEQKRLDARRPAEDFRQRLREAFERAAGEEVGCGRPDPLEPLGDDAGAAELAQAAQGFPQEDGFLLR